MKKYILFGLLLNFLLCNLLHAQKVNITVVDKDTRAALENATVSYMESNEGTITNSEGKASINVKDKSNIKISMINYEEQIIKANELKESDTIYLVSKVFQLDEVTVNSFDLNKALRYVVENYSKLYNDVPFEKQCDFKETVEIDGKLKRLIIAKINWWDKSYERKKNEVKFRLGEISYYKNSPFDIFTDAPIKNQPSKSGHIVLSSVINSIYLNLQLKELIPLLANSTVNLEDSPSDVTIVSFETLPISSQKAITQYKGTVTFAKSTKAILAISLKISHQNNIEKIAITETKSEGLLETINGFLLLGFYKTANDKLSLKVYETVVNTNITYKKNVHAAEFVNKIYVLNETNVNKVNNSGLIDLTKPIYDSLPSKEVKSTNGILLTDREKEFIFKKD